MKGGGDAREGSWSFERKQKKRSWGERERGGRGEYNKLGIYIPSLDTYLPTCMYVSSPSRSWPVERPRIPFIYFNLICARAILSIFRSGVHRPTRLLSEWTSEMSGGGRGMNFMGPKSPPLRNFATSPWRRDDFAASNFGIFYIFPRRALWEGKENNVNFFLVLYTMLPAGKHTETKNSWYWRFVCFK